MAPAARAAGSSARQRELEVHVDGDGDAAAINNEGLCDRLFAFCHVCFESCQLKLPTALCTFFLS
jgi:hypothetical protein